MAYMDSYRQTGSPTGDSYYVLSLNILKALGGDTSIVYPDADAIWDEINKIYNNAGNRFDIVPLEKNITENGQYDYYPDGDADAFMPVNINVNVPQKYTDEQVFEIESNAIQQGYNQGYTEGEAEGKLTGREEGYTDGYNTGYGTGVTDGGNAQKAKLVDITITENGVYTKDDGYKTVTVEVETGIPEEELQQMLQEAMDEGYQDGYAEGLDDGAEDQKALLESITIKTNGTYNREDGWNEVVVDVTTSGGGDTGKPKIYNGFRLLSTDSSLKTTDRLAGNLSKVDFTQYDWSGVYDLEEFFGGFVYSYSYENGGKWYDANFDNFREGFNGEILSCKNMFKYEAGQKSYAPLAAIPDFSKFTNNLLNMSYAFADCTNLQTTINISKWNTSKVVDMSYMFYGCSSITSIPEFDCSEVRNVDNMFYSCNKLTTIPNMNFYNLKSFNFSSCWLSGATKITKIGELRCDSITDLKNIFGTSKNNNLTSFGGAKNLGKKYTVANTAGTNAFEYAPNLTYESVMNIINGLYDRASVGYPILALKLHANHLTLLSDDDIAIATNKGWTLS